MLKKVIRLVIQLLLVFVIMAGFIKLVTWSIIENNRIEIEKVNDHINKINENRASRGVL